MSSSEGLPTVPAQLPRIGNRFTRGLGRFVLALFGWRIEGELPNLPKLVLAGAPHTSNWDFIVAMLAMMSLGVKFSYLMKKEAFFWPFKNLFMRWGGIPLDRKASTGIVGQMMKWFEKKERIWVAITPEGTRSEVNKWKTGFLRVAYSAQVPVLIATWDYPNKRLLLGKCWQPTGDHEADAEAIKAYIMDELLGQPR